MKSQNSIILASGSPRRRELLKQLAVNFQVAAADIDESFAQGETPRDYVMRLSREKALAGFTQGGGRPAGDWVLTPSCCWMAKSWANPESRLRQNDVAAFVGTDTPGLLRRCTGG